MRSIVEHYEASGYGFGLGAAKGGAVRKFERLTSRLEAGAGQKVYQRLQSVEAKLTDAQRAKVETRGKASLDVAATYAASPLATRQAAKTTADAVRAATPDWETYVATLKGIRDQLRLGAVDANTPLPPAPTGPGPDRLVSQARQLVSYDMPLARAVAAKLQNTAIQQQNTSNGTTTTTQGGTTYDTVSPSAGYGGDGFYPAGASILPESMRRNLPADDLTGAPAEEPSKFPMKTVAIVAAVAVGAWLLVKRRRK